MGSNTCIYIYIIILSSRRDFLSRKKIVKIEKKILFKSEYLIIITRLFTLALFLS